MSRINDAVQRCAEALEVWKQGGIPFDVVRGCFAHARQNGSPAVQTQLDELYQRHLEGARDETERYRAAVVEAGEKIDAAQQIIDSYGDAPRIVATCLGIVNSAHGPMVQVASGSGRRHAAIAHDLDPSTLLAGTEVTLSADSSVVVDVGGPQQVGEVAEFDRAAGPDRVLITAGTSEKVVVQAGVGLDVESCEPGDKLLWDRSARLALERLSGADRNPFAIEELDVLPLSKVGGRKSSLARLEQALTNCLLFPERAKMFGLPTSNVLLLHGPPGTGKTYLVRAALSEIQRRSGKKVMFAVVNAAGWESPYVGVTQQNISNLFASLRRAAEDGQIAVCFVDEIDAIGRTRGGLSSHHADRALATFLTELSGFKSLPNVSVVAAANRKDILDPALLSRFGDEIEVPRPDLRTAREIFEVHLPSESPYATGSTRREMIDLAVSKLYAPNADAELCILKLRDGRTRPVLLHELVSARLIQQIAQSAGRTACVRASQEEGICEFHVEDMQAAIEDARDRLRDSLTHFNAHSMLDSLPADESVVAVEHVRRRVERSYRYLSLS